MSSVCTLKQRLWSLSLDFRQSDPDFTLDDETNQAAPR